MVTMLLGGLWHGAAWTFVYWGAFHGALLAAERALGVRGVAASRRPLTQVLRAVLTFHLVCLGWVMFRAPDFYAMGVYLQRLFAPSLAWDTGTESGLAWAGVLAGLVVFQHCARRFQWRRLWDDLHPSLQGAVLASVVLLVSLLHVDEVAFIYFQF